MCWVMVSDKSINFLSLIAVSTLLFIMAEGSFYSGTSWSAGQIIAGILVSTVVNRWVEIEQTKMLGKKSTLHTSSTQEDKPIATVAMSLIEAISIAARSFSLGFRYAANNVSGHLITHVVTAGIIVEALLVTWAGTLLGIIILGILESTVAVIQSGVYSVLLSTYLGI